MDIKPTLSSLGTKPNFFFGNSVYTVPVIIHGELPKIVQESWDIIEYLDTTFPDTPQLVPKGTKALLTVYDNYVKDKITMTVFTMIVLPTFNFVTEKDKAYFRESREKWLGAKLEDVCPPEKKEAQLTKLKDGLDQIAKMLDKNGEGGIFVLGDRASKGDFTLVGIFCWLKAVDEDSWKTLMTWGDGRWSRLWAASEEWRLGTA